VTPHLDGKHVVFGCVLQGFNDVIKAVEKVLGESMRSKARARA
jgi:cyclophilin family peptidyl-prolyl cis-trans isomerase